MKSNGHECKWYIGRITDVVVRRSDNTIRCRKCLNPLSEDEVDPEMLKKIKGEKENELQKKKQRKKKTIKSNGKSKTN